MLLQLIAVAEWYLRLKFCTGNCLYQFEKKYPSLFWRLNEDSTSLKQRKWIRRKKLFSLLITFCTALCASLCKTKTFFHSLTGEKRLFLHNKGQIALVYLYDVVSISTFSKKHSKNVFFLERNTYRAGRILNENPALFLRSKTFVLGILYVPDGHKFSYKRCTNVFKCVHWWTWQKSWFVSKPQNRFWITIWNLHVWQCCWMQSQMKWGQKMGFLGTALRILNAAKGAETCVLIPTIIEFNFCTLLAKEQSKARCK